jgi:hypothetical protein
MDRQQLRGVLLCPDPRLSYLVATYTGVRPYFGHWANTPHYPDRRRLADDWFGHGKSGPWLAQVDYVLLNTGVSPPGPHSWAVLYQADGLVLWQRVLNPE